MNTNDREPNPLKNNYPAIWDLVLKDMKVRDKVGEERYGTRLQPFNGRNALIDLYQELLDAVVYIRQKIYEESAQNENCENIIEKDTGFTNSEIDFMNSLHCLMVRNNVSLTDFLGEYIFVNNDTFGEDKLILGLKSIVCYMRKTYGL